MTSDAFLLAAAALLPFLGSVVTALLPRSARSTAAVLAGTVTLASLACIAALYPQVSGGGTVSHGVDWLPSLGVSLMLRLDGLAWLFAVLVLGIGALVVLYARYYMAPDDPVPRLFAFFLG
ncbi:MAG: monovalent cation/H+ antiporter subunit A, partial [Methylobacterium sp.]